MMTGTTVCLRSRSLEASTTVGHRRPTPVRYPKGPESLLDREIEFGNAIAQQINATNGIISGPHRKHKHHTHTARSSFNQHSRNPKPYSSYPIPYITYPRLHFVFALVTPLWQSRKTLHEWKDNSVLAKPVAACTHLSSTVSQLLELQVQKNRRFHVPQPTFLFPLETPLWLSHNMLHGWKDNSMLAKPLAACTSIFNSFRVIRCLSQCVSPKIAILPHFCFSWGRPRGNHAKCCMDRKRIRCLQIASQHIPIYL